MVHLCSPLATYYVNLELCTHVNLLVHVIRAHKIKEKKSVMVKHIFNRQKLSMSVQAAHFTQHTEDLPLSVAVLNAIMKEMKSRWKDDSDLVTEPVKWPSKLEATDSFLIYR